MKTTPALILLVAASAASGYAGYYFGQNKGGAAATDTANAKHAAAAGGRTSAGGSSVGGSVSLASLMKGPGAPDAEALAAWAKNLTPQECVDLVKSLQAGKGGLVRDTVLGAVLKSWAKSDPKGVLASIDQLKSPKLREDSVDIALKTMGAQDPKGVLQWLKDNPGTASAAATQARYDAAIAGIAATDPKGAFDVVSALSEGNDRDRQNKSDALKALTDTLAQAGHFTDAQQLLATLPAGQTRDDAMDHLAESWASYSPEDATTWAAALTDPAERTRLEARAVSTWASSDPLAAATWAASADQQALANADPNAPKDPLSGPGMVLANAIMAWSQDDLDGPGAFLNTLPASPDKDRAVAVFTMQASEEDPESAAKWLGTISDSGVRNSVTMVVAMQMYQQDPAMFTNFINTNDQMSADEKQNMQRIAPIMAMSSQLLSGSGGKGGNFMSNMIESMLTGKSNSAMNAIRARVGQPGGNPFAPRGGQQPPAPPAGQ